MSVVDTSLGFYAAEIEAMVFVKVMIGERSIVMVMRHDAMRLNRNQAQQH